MRTAKLFFVLGLTTNIGLLNDAVSAPGNLTAIPPSPSSRAIVTFQYASVSNLNARITAEGEEDDEGLEGLEGFDGGSGLRGFEEEEEGLKGLDSDSEEDDSFLEDEIGESTETLDALEDQEIRETLQDDVGS